MYTEGNTEASVLKGKDVKVCRSHQAVACKNRYTEELGKPQRFLVCIQRYVWYTAIKAMMGNLKQNYAGT